MKLPGEQQLVRIDGVLMATMRCARLARGDIINLGDMRELVDLMLYVAMVTVTLMSSYINGGQSRS